MPGWQVFCCILLFLFCSACNKPNKAEAKPIAITPSLPVKAEHKLDFNTPKNCKDDYFNQAFNEMTAMLEGRIPLSFKRAAFLIEWAYYRDSADYQTFCAEISAISQRLETFIEAKKLTQYKTAKNYALLEFFAKPNTLNGYKPYTYDFEDFYGEKDYGSVLLTKLLKTHRGQCRSMPILYKIISDEIKAESYLAFGQNHLFVKHLDENGKWVNIELTNGHIASDSYMISSMDISAESIRNGIYMKELSNQESVAYCLIDLAFAYESKYGNDAFALTASQMTLKYFPNCTPALMHKANTLSNIGKSYLRKHGKDNSPFLTSNYKEYQATRAKLDSLGQRSMSPEKYEAWVRSVESEKQQRLATQP